MSAPRSASWAERLLNQSIVHGSPGHMQAVSPPFSQLGFIRHVVPSRFTTA